MVQAFHLFLVLFGVLGCLQGLIGHVEDSGVAESTEQLLGEYLTSGNPMDESKFYSADVPEGRQSFNDILTCISCSDDRAIARENDVRYHADCSLHNFRFIERQLQNTRNTGAHCVYRRYDRGTGATLKMARTGVKQNGGFFQGNGYYERYCNQYERCNKGAISANIPPHNTWWNQVAFQT